MSGKFKMKAAGCVSLSLSILMILGMAPFYFSVLNLIIPAIRFAGKKVEGALILLVVLPQAVKF